MKVVRVMVVLLPSGPDQVSVEVGGPSPFPELEGQPATLRTEVRRGYAEEWVRQMGFDPSLVTVVGRTVVPFSFQNSIEVFDCCGECQKGFPCVCTED